jgi:prephenate dehydrogenase
MGGSLALALRGRCAALLGIDRDPRVVELALARRVVDRASPDPAEILPAADFVILAAPVDAILALLADLPSLHPAGPVVFDLGSTKRAILQAMQALPPRFDPLGGHPMCGKERGGLENADPGLFTGAPFVLAPLDRTSPEALSLARQLVDAIGARPLTLDAATHDRWTAATSHLPYLLASALVLATPPEALALAGPGFRSSTRVAGSDPAMMLDILFSNPDNLVAALARLRAQLDGLEARLQAGDRAGLQDCLAAAARVQHSLAQVAP